MGGEKYEIEHLNGKADKGEKWEDAVSIVAAYEEIIKTKEKNIICVACRQGLIFERFKQKENLIKMITDFGISKSTMMFKIKKNIISVAYR